MRKYLRPIILFISVITFFSGIFQILKPDLVLHLVGAESNATARHCFAIVGMFMALFGGMTIHSLYSSDSSKVVILWAAFQKTGAFTAVAIGYSKGIFAAIALSVAFFDLFSAVIFLIFWYHLKQ